MTQGLDLVSSLDASVHAHGDRPVFGVRATDGWHWTTYAELARMVDAFRSALAVLGVTAGDRVAVISRNRLEWAVGAYAAFGLGAAIVPMYEAQHEGDWRHILRDSGASVCLVADESIAARVRALGVASVARIIVFDAALDDPLAYARLAAEGARAPRPATVPAPTAIAEIVYTSGTTGTPKGVLLTHANIVSNVASVLKILPVNYEVRTLAFLPWAHVFGGDELHGVIHIGGSMAICDSVDHLAEQLLEVRPSALFAVPRVWNRIYQGVRARIERSSHLVRALFDAGRRASAKARRGEALTAIEHVELGVARRLVFSKVAARFGGRLEYAVSAAATLSPEVAELIDDLGIIVLEAYGMTESSACATINPPKDRRIGSVGKPIPGVRVAVDPSAPGSGGGSGEIIIYGHGVMAGYHALPAETAKTLTGDGGLRTGDLGRLDADGFLYITGRLKELYKLENGKYVAPAPLEEKLTLSPLIAQAFIFGADRAHNVALIVPDATTLRAWATREGLDVSSWEPLVARPEVHALYEREIAAYSKEFRGYERIREFALLPEGFSTDNGMLTPTLKVRRRAVADRYHAQLDALYSRLPEREIAATVHA
jgi:long-chain acyl-CoA synthetase